MEKTLEDARWGGGWEKEGRKEERGTQTLPCPAVGEDGP